MNNQENPQDLAACRACWEKNPEVPFADFWAGWKAKGESVTGSKPVAIVRHTKTEVFESFDAVVLAGAILEGVVEDGTKLYARPSAPVPPQVDYSEVKTALLGVLLSEIKQDEHGFIQLSGIARSNFDRALEASGAKLTKEPALIPAPQAEDKPVAWYKPHWNGKSAEWCLGEKLEGAVFAEMWKPLFTHSDAGEVERIKELAEAESIRAGKAAESMIHWKRKSDRLRALLAERDDLLQMFISNSDDSDVVELSRLALSATKEGKGDE